MFLGAITFDPKRELFLLRRKFASWALLLFASTITASFVVIVARLATWGDINGLVITALTTESAIVGGTTIWFFRGTVSK